MWSLRASLVLLAMAAMLPAACGARASLSAQADGGGPPSGDTGGAGLLDAGAADADSGTPLCMPGDPPTVIASAGSPVRLAVDATTVYWTELSGSVRATPKAGGATVVLTTGHAFPLGIALDDTSVFFTDRDQHSVLRVPKQGGPAEKLWVGPLGIWPRDVGVDGDTAYWITMIPGSVLKVAKSGGPTTTLVAPQSMGMHQPERLVLREDDILWTDFAAGRVLRVAKSGGMVTTLAAGPSGYSALAVDGERVFVTNRSLGTIEAIPLAGGAPVVLVSGAGDVDSLAIDDTRIYYNGGVGQKSIQWIGKQGGAATVIATDQPSADSLVVDGSCLYWVTSVGIVRASRD